MPNETAFASSHRQKKTWLTVLAVLAAVVAFATVAALTMPASAMTGQDTATPETAATAETAATPAPTEASESVQAQEQAQADTAALPTGVQVPDGYTDKRTVRDEENGFAVTVYAPEGVIPADAKLCATLLPTDSEEYKQAGEQLAEQTDLLPADGVATLSQDSETADGTEQNAAPSVGYAALDIHFEDADGNEIEPNGEVFVAIDAAGLIPEDADPESVTVQHHAETPAETPDVPEVDVQTVADTAPAAEGVEGTVAVTTPDAATETTTEDATVTAPEGKPETEVQAAFEVKDFSTFTITWSSSWKTYFNLTVHYVDENGSEIQGTRSQSASISRDRTITFADYAGQIQGYTYQAAHYQAVDGAVITSVRATGRGSSHTLTFYNGDQVVPTDNNTAYETSDTKYRDIYLVYKQDSGQQPGGSGDTGRHITFKYYDGNNINQNQAITDRNAIKYSIVLIDENGNESYVLPEGSTVDESVTFYTDTVNMTSTLTYEQMGINVPGYTFDNSYAYFYWEGDFKGNKNDVVLFHNFGKNSTDYGTSYDSYIGFTRSDATGDDYRENQFGNEGTGYFAYNPTGTLRIVLHKVTGQSNFTAHFVDAYQYPEGNSQSFARTAMTTKWENGHYYGMLAELPEGTPTREGYTFDGWYMDVDEDGNGTGTRVDDPSDDTTHYRTDATYYAKWVKDDEPDQPGGEVTQEATVTTGKTAVLKDDGSGNYDLTLTVSGDRGTSENKQKVDVLFILDESNSMGDNWGYQKRIAAAKNAIGQITGYGDNDGLSDNKNLDVQYALVGFGGGDSDDAEWTYWGWDYSDSYKDAGVEQEWTSSPSDIYNEIPNITHSDWGSTNRYGGGTNYEAGFRTGKDVLDSARSDAMKVVIFISDGGPGYYYNDWGGTAGIGNPSNYNSTALQHGVDEVKTLTGMNYFYFVGVTGDVTSDVYTQITAAAPVAQDNKQAISAANPDDLLEAFKDIQSDISHFAAKDVTITDPLSQYADLVLTDGAPQFTITVKRAAYSDSDGTPHAEQTWTGTVGNNGKVTFKDADGHDQTATARVSSDNRTIYLDLPDNYELEEGYTYSISTVIAPSQAAKDAGMDSDAAKQTPDPGTGTHADKGEQGFWSNDNENAKVTYTANGEKGSKNFPMPVIQVTEETCNLTITKDVSIASGAFPAGGKSYTFTISTAVADVEGKTYSSEDGQVSTSAFTEGTGGTYTATVTLTVSNIEADAADASVTLTGMPAGTYTVTENTSDGAADIADYTLGTPTYAVTDSDSATDENPTGEAKVTLNAKDTAPATVAVTNTYTHENVTVNFMKVDADHTTPLSGATFNLYYTESEGNDAQKLYYCTDGTWSVVTDNGEKTKQEITSDNTGNLIHMPALETPTGNETQRVYYLEEVAAPAGYQLPSYNIRITVTNTGTFTVYGSGQITDTDNDGVYLIPNSTGTELPETGGMGTTFLTIGGLLLMAAAVGGGCVLRRRRGKEAG